MATYKKFLVCADSHGHLIDPEARSKFIEFKKTWKPNYTLCLGDILDLTCLRKGASDEDRQIGVAQDWQAAMSFLDIGFDYLTLGNHDSRLWEAAEHSSNALMRESAEELVQTAEREFKRRKIQWCEYNVDKFLQLPEGGPKLLHGFLAGMNPAKAHFERFGSCLFGHVHAPSSYTAKHIDQGQAYALGCMANIQSMTYAQRFPNRLGWRQGFGFGIINTKTGRWSFWQVVKEDGDWISPMGIL